MDANTVPQDQRVVSPPNQTRCGSSSKKTSPPMMANPSAAASDRAAPPTMPPPMMHSHRMNQPQHAMMPQQEQHYAATTSSMAPSAAWGQHHQQGYHHPHAPTPPMRYAHHNHPTNMPPPPPPSSSYRGRGIHDEFIFQAGPPRQQSYQRLPPCASDYQQQHPQQRHAYHYPTAVPPHTMAHQHHHSMPSNVNGIPSPHHELPTHVTPQFKRSVVSRGSSTGSRDHNNGSISSTPQSSGALLSDIEGGATTTTTTHRHRVAKGGEKKDKLAPVDAIFAAGTFVFPLVHP